MTGAFASSLADDLLGNGLTVTGAEPEAEASQSRVDYWFHGHVHNSCDYFIGSTRVIANPHGYGRENRNFDPCLVVEIGE